MQFMEKDWCKVFDHSLEILHEKMTEEGVMTPEILQKIKDVQQKEGGVSRMALERFGPDHGRTDAWTDRTWIQ